MRLFAALPVPEEIVDSVAAQLPPPPDSVRTIPVERWHVTLAFYGQVTDPGGLVHRLRQRLQRLPAPRLRVRIAGAGTFGPRLAYLAVVDAEPAPFALADLAVLCRRAGRTADRGRFCGHVTVARARRSQRIPPAYVKRLERVGSEPWPVAGIALMESILTAGPRYEVRETIPLPDGL